MIQYYNRKTQALETEKVYGTAFLDLGYKNKIGYFVTDKLLPKKLLSRVMGAVEDSSWSKNKIGPFVRNYGIDMNEYEDSEFRTFNEFFIRRFKPGKRPFAADPKFFCAGAEGRYLAFENISASSKVLVKGIAVHLGELFRDEKIAKEFEGGTLIISRLCPVDYHRYHFPVGGEIERAYTVHGDLHSVNPVALVRRPEIFLINEREITTFNNPEFGKVAMIEVGALGVGKLVQSYAQHLPPKKKQSQNTDASCVKFDKGQEKGYFLFGGSTVIWLLQSGKIQLSNDLIRNSQQGIETWIPLGDVIGERKQQSG